MKRRAVLILAVALVWAAGLGVAMRGGSGDAAFRVEPKDGLCWAYALSEQLKRDRQERGLPGFDLSVGYLALAKLSDGGRATIESRLPMPFSVGKLGAMPEAVFPTTAKLLEELPALSREEAASLLAPELVADARGFARRYAGIGSSDPWVNVLDERLMKEDALRYLGEDKCSALADIHVCYRNGLAPYADGGGVSAILRNEEESTDDFPKYHMVYLDRPRAQAGAQGFDVLDFGRPRWMSAEDVHRRLRGLLVRRSALNDRDVPWSASETRPGPSGERLLYFTRFGCEYCRAFEADLQADPALKGAVLAMPRQRLLQGRDDEAVSRYAVKYYPTFVVIDAKGRDVRRLDGYLSKETLLEVLKGNAAAREGEPANEQRSDG